VDARIAGQCLGSLFNKDTGALADAKQGVVESLSQACQGVFHTFAAYFFTLV
jgi:hypothetical protein